MTPTEIDFSDGEEDAATRPKPKPFSNVTEIVLHLANLHPINIQVMVESCLALKTLKLTLTYPVPLFLALGQLDEAIVPAHHTLETLELLYDPTEPMTYGDDWEEGLEMGISLVTYKKLRSVKLGMAFVSGRPALNVGNPSRDFTMESLAEDMRQQEQALINVLPPTIETLHLQRYRDECYSGMALFKNLEEMLDGKTFLFPYLKSISVEVAKEIPERIFGTTFYELMDRFEGAKAVEIVEKAQELQVDLTIKEALEE